MDTQNSSAKRWIGAYIDVRPVFCQESHRIGGHFLSGEFNEVSIQSKIPRHPNRGWSDRIDRAPFFAAKGGLQRPSLSPHESNTRLSATEESKRFLGGRLTTTPTSQPTSNIAFGESWTGIAESRKVGPFLSGDDVYVELPSSRWPKAAESRRVVVTGTAVIRHDLPVFISKGHGSDPAGIPVPEGTDLYKASERTVIENAQWRFALEQNAD